MTYGGLPFWALVDLRRVLEIFTKYEIINVHGHAVWKRIGLVTIVLIYIIFIY